MKRGHRINQPIPLTAPADIQTTAEWEAWVVEHASIFTLCFKIGPGEVQRHEFHSLIDAIGMRANNPRGMVYAVTEAGRSVMIGPAQYETMLRIRGELQ